MNQLGAVGIAARERKEWEMIDCAMREHGAFLRTVWSERFSHQSI
jgi:hypothetical protein